MQPDEQEKLRRMLEIQANEARKATAEAQLMRQVKEKELVQEFFNKVAKEEEKSAYGKDEVRKALEMGAVQKLLISEAFDEIDTFEELAEASGAEVFIISTETREGVQLRDIGGIAAILRFAIN